MDELALEIDNVFHTSEDLMSRMNDTTSFLYDAGHGKHGIKHLPIMLFDVDTRTTVDLSRELDISGGYIAISHVWGREHYYTAEQLGVKGVDWKISLSDPEKLERIISAVKYHKTKYCWVDVLCIPQGPDKHTERRRAKEIPYMGYYYSNAIMTLVMATRSEFQTGGDKVSSVVSGGMAGFMNRSLDTGASVFRLGSMGLNHEEWFTRVWTYQEAVFSDAITYVTFDGKHHNLYYIMKHMNEVERSPYEEPTQLDLVAAVFHAARDKSKDDTTLVTTMYRSCLRQCTREQDRVFGIMSLLGTSNVRADYGIPMEDLNVGVIIAASQSKANDISWLCVGGNAREEGFLQPMYRRFTYVGNRWQQDKDWSKAGKEIVKFVYSERTEEEMKKFEEKFMEESKEKFNKQFNKDYNEYKLEFRRNIREDFNNRLGDMDEFKEKADKVEKLFIQDSKQLTGRKEHEIMAKVGGLLAHVEKLFEDEFNKKFEEEFETFKEEKLKEISQEELEKENKKYGYGHLDIQMYDMAKVIYCERAASMDSSFGFEGIKKFGISTNDISHVLVDYDIKDGKDCRTIAKTIDDAKGKSLYSCMSTKNPWKKELLSRLRVKLSQLFIAVAENKEGKFPLLIDGDVQEGDKILRLPMVDDLKRTLCIVSIAATSPNIFKRKGVCLYKEFKVESDNYSTYRYIL